MVPCTIVCLMLLCNAHIRISSEETFNNDLVTTGTHSIPTTLKPYGYNCFCVADTVQSAKTNLASELVLSFRACDLVEEPLVCLMVSTYLSSLPILAVVYRFFYLPTANLPIYHNLPILSRIYRILIFSTDFFYSFCYFM